MNDKKIDKLFSKCVNCGKLLYSNNLLLTNSKFCSKTCARLYKIKISNQTKGPTNLEIKGRELLEKLDIVFFEQVMIEEKYLVDVFLPKQNIIIEWYGDFWHSKESFKKEYPSQIKNKQRDEKRIKFLKNKGYIVLIFWESDVFNNPDEVINKIKNELDKNEFY